VPSDQFQNELILALLIENEQKTFNVLVTCPGSNYVCEYKKCYALCQVDTFAIPSKGNLNVFWSKFIFVSDIRMTASRKITSWLDKRQSDRNFRM
jgi:hypothetical protein